MKPKIIYVKSDGTLDLTREELDKLVSDAYFSGYEDGGKAGREWGTSPEKSGMQAGGMRVNTVPYISDMTTAKSNPVSTWYTTAYSYSGGNDCGSCGKEKCR